MPRSVFDEPKYPPVNKLRAFILEREMVAGYTHKDLADIGGVSYATMRRLMTMDPWKWKPEVRNRICRALELKQSVIIEDGTEQEVLC